MVLVSRNRPARRFARPVLEEVEQRRHCSTSVSSYTDDTFTDLSATNSACVLVGDNGDLGGIPTAYAGPGDESAVGQYTTWDEDWSDGFDSGWVSVTFSVNMSGDGSGTLEVGDGGSSSYAAGTGAIHQVDIQAAVDGGGFYMSWRNVTVNFYSGGQLVDSASPADTTADTLAATNYDQKESISTVSTDASNCNGVRITAQVRLAAVQGAYPAWTDIFGRVAIS